MRLTLEPGGDLEVPDGATLAECRPALARLTGRDELTDAVLTVDGSPVPHEQVAGSPPWEHGCVLRVGGRGWVDGAVLAVDAPWHVAVTRGPGTGTVAVPGRDRTVRVGREPSRTARTTNRSHGPGAPDDERHRPEAPETPGALTLTDGAVSRRHLQVRARPPRRGRSAGRWQVRDLGSTNGTVVVGWGGRGRQVGRGWRALGSEQVIRLGEHELVLRRGPCATTTAGADRATPPDHDSASAGVRPPGRTTPPVAAWLTPAVGAALIALVTRNPLFLLLGALGPITVLAPALVAAGAGRAARRRTAPPGVSDPALLDVRAAALVRGAVPGPGTDTPARGLLGLEAVGVVGPRTARLAVTRALLADALLCDALMTARRRAEPDRDGTSPPSDTRRTPDPQTPAAHRPRGPRRLTLLHGPGAGADWDWFRWLDLRLGPAAPRVAREVHEARAVLDRSQGSGLVVCDGAGAWRTELDRWWLARPASTTGAVLLLEEDDSRLPGWCRWVIEVDAAGGCTLHGPGAARAPLAVVGAPRSWTERFVRRIAALDARVTADLRAVAGGEPPDRVALADLVDLRTADDVMRAWTARTASAPEAGSPQEGTLATPIGVAADGSTLEIDLVRDGPHALVAGTTGAGKSELLQTLVLGLALRHPPTALAVMLVDYKGGTSFGACRDLPHVVGEVTDLDQDESGRALAGLRAELHHRERLLSAAGVGDLESLRSLGRTAVPPRLLVVVDEFRALTEDLPDFVPGLVRIAAQGRSSGIHLVLATQRPAGAVNAQMRANLALRLCLRVTESADSVDVLDVTDAAALPPERPGRALLRRGPGVVEHLQSAYAAAPPAPRRPGTGQVRRAVPWEVHTRTGTQRPVGPVDRDHSKDLVGLAVHAARAMSLPPPRPPWLPPLPDAVAADELTDLITTDPPPREALLWGMADHPDQQRTGASWWCPDDGPLLIAGRSRSGRTTALRTLLVAALSRGRHVHAVGGAGLVEPAEHDHPCLGTVVGTQDLRRVGRLLALLATRTDVDVPTLLVVDDVGALLRALEQNDRGAGAELLLQVVRDAGRLGLAVAVAGLPADLTRLLPHAAARIVLGVADDHDDALLGVPRALSGGRRSPGRAVHLVAGQAVRSQVALPPCTAGTPHAAREAVPPVRLLPVPLEVAPGTLAAALRISATAAVGRTTPAAVPVGLGGDRAEPVLLPVHPGVLVVGPHGSGRTTALEVIGDGLRCAGWTVHTGAVGAGPLVLEGLVPVPGRLALLVDDLDLRSRTDPSLDETLAGIVARGVVVVVATATTARACTAYRGALAALRTQASLLVLAPAERGSQDVAGIDLGAVADPVHPGRPGRGAVVHRGRAVPVQVVHRPATGPTTAVL
ncbi:FtsK/SpoIIIE domain-containing protein [Actinotalea sp. K2]|uniref:FtsK/SpoIIIE domain-containing protein n=1 Tax=Actinotalea sp. K2 TaxID=2939438 RepID=UPI002016B398|nr:FtsK/SpoIIIE domain-containing protein [Actinotalea sp. K2]MCL3862748.1 FtsK/SpoIIIE domain-containing protein [Actinotalea sp. K2]